MILEIQFELFQGLSNKSFVVEVFIDTKYFFVFVKTDGDSDVGDKGLLVTLWWLYDNSRILMLVTFLMQ